MLSHVVEHIADPLDFLKLVFKLLKKGGTIYVEVPNYESFSRKYSQQYWYAWETPRHLLMFSPKTISGLFEKAGFKNISEKEVASKLNSGTVETYWDMMTEIGAPIVAALGKADDTMRQKIKTEVFELVSQRYPDHVAIDAGAIVISASK